MKGTRRPSRKLAAIVFTDMVGYSGLAQRNEAEPWKCSKSIEASCANLIASFGGKEISTVGDGFLLEFASAD